MRRLLFVVMCAITLSSTAQTLKGFTLGNKLEGPQTKEATVGGIEGVIMASTVADGRIYMIMFLPSDNGINTKRVYSHEFKTFKSGVEKNYNIELKWKASSDYSDNEGTWKTKDLTFFIMYDKNQYLDVPIEMSFIIMDRELNRMKEKEDAAAASSQF